MRLPTTQVDFQVDDPLIQRLFDAASAKCRQNLVDFCGRQVLVEGGGYHKIWLETQPMGGEMYAKRNLRAALNNQLLFMENQRQDGRLAGSIAVEAGQMVPQFNKIQGFCFPAPALNMYYWTGKDKAYLRLLQGSLMAFDAFLWRERDSNGDGCLESFCITDTGEDGALRYGDAPFWWTSSQPPTGFAVVPMASMDFMGFSVAARDTLAHISAVFEEDKAAFWRAQAEAVRAKIKSYLWSESRGACFDRDNQGRVMETLLHNNLRVMYFGGFDQGMADRFVGEHLLNPAAFWTPMPLPAVAANDPLFRNNPGNDWSGQPQGLTYQRALLALERYGYQKLFAPLAQKLFQAIGERCVFTQQFDTFTAQPAGDKDGYGPTMLAVLEYISRLYGVHVQGEEIWWGALGGGQSTYTQVWGERAYTLKCDGSTAVAYVDGKAQVTWEAGSRMVTDYLGNPLYTLPLR